MNIWERTTDMTIIFSIAAAAAVIFLIYVFVLVRPGKKRPHDPVFDREYAHRGLHSDTVPENSLTAFRLAAEKGYGIELDVQLSSDGEVYVFHDYTLVRMTGKDGMLSEKTAAQLEEIRLLSGGVVTDEKIPTLREVLDAVDGRVPILVELKGETTNTSLCPKADAILSEYRGPWCVESFNPMLIGWFRQNHPEVYRGMLSTDVFREKKKSILNFLIGAMALNIAARPDFIAYNYKYPERLCVKLCTRFFSANRFMWTARTPDEYRFMKGQGALTIFEGFLPEDY